MTLNLSPPQIILILVGTSLLPYIAIFLTSFTKIIIVLGILRTGLGLQATPPNMVLNGLAVILSFFIMQPIVLETWDLMKDQKINWDQMGVEQIGTVWENIKTPTIQFLRHNSKLDMRRFFMETARRSWPKEQSDKIREDNLLILIPSFILTEVTTAFQIGFIIYLPFLIIDLVVSNILLALGMMMISPTAISLPFKLLLFVLVDGWSRLLGGLVMTYRL